ncbi:YtxH domain-containing protein [Laceyella putida]|uniref:YtxH domain-containing protein n=1 Tax=Laceyella putida TaxID=110101 RepID=A0ABW2RKD9_9BACL
MGKGKYFVAGAIFGGLIGAAAALLATTKTGHEVRKELEKGLELAKERGKDLYFTMKSQVSTEDKWKKVNEEGTVLVNRWLEAPKPEEAKGESHRSAASDYISIQDKE